MSRGLREAVADWLMLGGALVLAASLFFAWSHQRPGIDAAALAGVPRDPTAWQVYSAADVLLAALALGLVHASFLGTRRTRAVVLAGALIAIAFVVHAANVPPTNGVATAVAPGARSGPGEVIALVALCASVLGLTVSFTAD